MKLIETQAFNQSGAKVKLTQCCSGPVFCKEMRYHRSDQKCQAETNFNGDCSNTQNSNFAKKCFILKKANREVLPETNKKTSCQNHHKTNCETKD
jgi:hypothetical protein